MRLSGTRFTATAVRGASPMIFLSRVSRKLLVYLTAFVAVAVVLLPFLWLFAATFKTEEQTYAYPPKWIPETLYLRNYQLLFGFVNMRQLVFNSLVYVVALVSGQVLFNSTAGFAFARMRFPGRETLFLVYLGTLMVPFAVRLVPTFIIMKELGWIDTFQGLLAPGVLGGAYGTFLMRQFFLGIPQELQDAAEIDGCGPLRTFLRIMLPLVKPAITSLVILTAVASWNDLLWPLVIMNSEKNKLLSVGLAGLYYDRGTLPFPTVLAGAMVALVPLVVLYLVAQRYFVQGIAFTGLK